MHSGPEGFHRQIWNWEPLPDGIAFFRDFDAGALGFPGCLHARLAYRLTTRDTLRLEYAAWCDHETAVSFTNHSYFNLSGSFNDCRGHNLTVYASNYAETEREADPIVTGRMLPVEGTPLDFRKGRPVGDAVDRTEFSEIRSAGGVDHYFPIEGEGLRAMASLLNPENGMSLLCRSDAPGLLVYTGNGLATVYGKNGTIYERNWGVCLETGRFPNAVNLPQHRKPVLLRPGEPYETKTEFVLQC
jgi:aldose 1-epimerase